MPDNHDNLLSKLDDLDHLDENAFAQAIAAADIDFTPAFVHGLLTAYCCTEDNTHGWATTLVADIDPDNEAMTTQLRYLNQTKNVIASQLSDSELSYQLLLHNTAETLHDEVLLVREWASGYWLGAEATDLVARTAHDDLSREFLGDLTQIIAMPVPSESDIETASTSDGYVDQYDSSDDLYDNDTGDDTRADILEIQEYCRAGAMGVFLASWSS